MLISLLRFGLFGGENPLSAPLSDADWESVFDEAHNHTESIYLSIFTQQQKYVVGFIEDNLGSLATLIALYKPFNNHPLIDPENSFEIYDFVLEGLEEALPENPHTLNFKNEVERLRYHYAR